MLPHTIRDRPIQANFDALVRRVDTLAAGGTPPDGTDKTFVFDQSVPASVWTIDHTLDKQPSVTVVDTAGTEVWGQVQHISLTQLVITFSAPFGGKAYLN